MDETLQAPLEVGVPRTATLVAAEQHRYPLPLAHDKGILIEATQDGLDLVVELMDSEDRSLLTIDRLGRLGPERICWISPRADTYSIAVRPFAAGSANMASGAYELSLLRSRPATEQDRACIEATQRFREASDAEGDGRPEAFDEAARLWESAGEPLNAAIAWRAAGDARQDAGALNDALTRFEFGYTVAKAASLPALQVSLRNRQGRVLRQAERLAEAAEAFDDALALAKKVGDVRGEATLMTNRGLVDWDLGDAFRAQEWYRKALSLWRQLEDPVEIAQALRNLGEALGTANHHEEAFDVLSEALALTRDARADQREASVLATIAWTHYLRGEPAEGIAPMRHALALRRQVGDRWSESGLLDRLGTLLRASDDPEAAEEAYRQALAIAASLSDADGYVAAIRVSLGCLLTERDQPPEASDLLALAAAYFESNPNSQTHTRSHTAYCQARLARRHGDLDAALTHARETLSIVEAMRERAREQGHRFRPIPFWQDYAALEVSLLIERYRAEHNPRDLDLAFEAADRIRARRLFELVATTRSGAASAANRSRDRREQLLQEQLSSLATKRAEQLTKAGHQEGSDTVHDAAIRRLQLELEAVRAGQRAAARERGTLGSPRPVTVDDARELLGPKTVLLTYVLGTEASHLIALTPQEMSVFDIPSQTVLESHAEALHAALQNSDEDLSPWQLVADHLGPMLLPPAALPVDAQRLLISVQGALHYLPFGVLPTPKASDQGSTARRLLDDFEVVSIPSASVLAALRARHERRPRPPKTVAIFADAVFSPQDPRVSESRTGKNPSDSPSELQPADSPTERGISLDRLPQGPLPRLPATADEADAIGKLVAKDLQLQLRGWQATKQAVLETDLSAYRILHFATHAWVDERFPELSGLLLARLDPSGRELDGSLHLHEIDSLHLTSDLTVLSGCQTALGRKVRGDGLLGLTQGFFNAGSRQILVSLWSVDDRAASLLMAEFYRQMLSHGHTPSAALQRAQRWLRSQDGFEAPRYWAPFVLQGDG